MNKDQVEIIRQKYNCRIIDQAGEYLFNSSDIGKILGVGNIRQNMQNFNDIDKKIIKIYNSNRNGGNPNQTYLSYNGVCKILTKSRKPNVFQIATDFGINILRQTDSCIEAEILNNIKIAFDNELSIDQYTIDKYRIDLYFPDYKLALECDENGHNADKNKMLDSIREKYIKDNLGCKFIRFKPYSIEFNIFKIINKIYKYIKNINSPTGRPCG